MPPERGHLSEAFLRLLLLRKYKEDEPRRLGQVSRTGDFHLDALSDLDLPRPFFDILPLTLRLSFNLNVTHWTHEKHHHS
jgi:hypothetical protein